MKKLIHTVIISTVALAGATQFIGCSDAVAPEDPPEAAQEEEEEESGPEGEGGEGE
jgi:hypothetical protein